MGSIEKVMVADATATEAILAAELAEAESQYNYEEQAYDCGA